MTSIKDALKVWQTKNEGKVIAEESTIKLNFLMPPITKMDPALKDLGHLEQLSLSTNQIDKIANLNAFKNLKILSLSRNNIKSFAGIEQVAETLEQLWFSYNIIEKLKGIGVLKNLKVLYLSNNRIKDWKEFDQLKDLPNLQELTFNGNPLSEKHIADGDYVQEIQNRLPKLKKLDGEPLVVADE